MNLTTIKAALNKAFPLTKVTFINEQNKKQVMLNTAQEVVKMVDTGVIINTDWESASIDMVNEVAQKKLQMMVEFLVAQGGEIECNNQRGAEVSFPNAKRPFCVCIARHELHTGIGDNFKQVAFEIFYAK